MLVFREFLNANETRSYPLHDKASKLATTGEQLPDNVIVDANIWIPRSVGNFVYISAVSITNFLVTVTLAATDDTPFCGAVASSFVPIAVINLKKPVSRYKNYPITPLIDGVGGWIAFGGAVDSTGTISMLFSKPSDSLLVDRVVRAYPELPVKTFGKVGVTPPLSGLIKLKGTLGGIRTFGAVVTIGLDTKLVGMIGLDLGTTPVEQLEKFVGPCGHRPGSNNCNITPITSINGVVPNAFGNINITFESAISAPGATNGITLNYPLGLSEVCKKEDFVVITDEAGECKPLGDHSGYVPSGDGGAYVPSVIPGDPPPPNNQYNDPAVMPGACGDYCETFKSGGVPDLAVITGSFAIARRDRDAGAPSVPEDNTPEVHSVRYISALQRFNDQFAIDTVCSLNTASSNRLRAIINPIGGIYEGHLIFGYANPINFYVLGVTLSSLYDSASPNVPLHPDGSFFIAKKISGTAPVGSILLDNFGAGLKYVAFPGSIVTPASIEAGLKLGYSDYNFDMTFIKNGSFIDVEWSVSFDTPTGVKKVVNQPFSIPFGVSSPDGPWSTFNDIGLAGLGNVGAKTEFDNFYINTCPDETTIDVDNCHDMDALDLDGVINILPPCLPPGGFYPATLTGPINVLASDTITLPGTTTAFSNIILMSSTTNVEVSQKVRGTGIPTGATVSSIILDTSITISTDATASGAVSLTFEMLEEQIAIKADRKGLLSGTAEGTPPLEGTSYTVVGKLRLLNDGKEARIIFAFHQLIQENPPERLNQFYFAGVTLEAFQFQGRPFPNGGFFIGRKINQLGQSNDGPDLGFEYETLYASTSYDNTVLLNDATDKEFKFTIYLNQYTDDSIFGLASRARIFVIMTYFISVVEHNIYANMIVDNTGNQLDGYAGIGLNSSEAALLELCLVEGTPCSVRAIGDITCPLASGEVVPVTCNIRQAGKIASGEAFGTPLIIMDINPLGIPSEESFSESQVTHDYNGTALAPNYIYPWSIPSDGGVGTPIVQRGGL